MYSLRTLGALSLSRDASLIEPLETQRRTLTILTVLATDRSVTRDRLMALLWPDSDTERARGSLKQAIHSLRHQLETPDLVLGRIDLSLNPARITSDVGRFQDDLQAGRLREAVALYQGAFLDGVHLNGSGELEEWVEARRTSLAVSFRDALERLAREAENRGDQAEAIRWWTRRSAEDPLDGKAALHLMEALEAGGQPTAALQHLRSHEQTLHRELGTAPDPAIVALGARLLRHVAPAPAPSWRGGATSPGPAAGPEQTRPTPPAVAPAPSPRVFPLKRAALIGLVVIAAVGIAMAAYHPPPAAQVDPNLVVVAPFDVLDSSLELWREGLMDILTEDLDGAGPLRTVAQSLALRHWDGRANRTTAGRLGERTGAGLVMYGTMARRGEDSVSIRVSLLDLADQASEVELLEVVGSENQMGQLSDSIGVKILRRLGRDRPIGSQRRVSIGSRSLPALKEFLKGEQFYRRGLLDSALARYDRAITDDSTFALALRRMAWILGMGAVTSWQYADQDEYFQRAVTHNHGLSPRDSMLLKADSLAQFGTRGATVEKIVESLYGSISGLEELARRYPDDPGIWYELGERRLHGSPPAGGFPGLALEAFDRAIALDPGFAPGYQHTVQLAFQLGHPDRARNYARAYSALNPSDLNAPALRLAMLVLDSGGVHAPAVWRQIKEANASTLRWAGSDHFRYMTDTAETAIVLLRELMTGTHDISGSAPSVADTARWPQMLSAALVFRGHLRAAASVNRAYFFAGDTISIGGQDDRFLDLALWKILPDSIARQTYGYGLSAESDWSAGRPFATPRFLRGLPFWYDRRDSVSLSRFLQRAAQAAASSQPGPAALRGRYFEFASRGYLALLHGDSAEAERQFSGISDTLCAIGTCFNEKLVLARLVAARGDDQRAAELLDRWEMAGPNSTFAIIAALDRAEIAERLGDEVTAIQRYQFVIEAWRRADPELQPFVAQARAGLARYRR